MNNDELLQYLIEMGAIQQEDAGLQRKRARVDALRSGGPARGQMVGRHYVGADPLQHVSNALGDGMAAYQDMRLDGQERELGQRRAELLRRRKPASTGMIDRGVPGWQMTPEL